MFIASSIVSMLTLASVAVPTSTGAPELESVRRTHTVELPASLAVSSHRFLPGRIGVELDIDGRRTAIARLAERFEPSIRTTIEPLESGHRLRIVHPDDRLVVALGRDSIAYGTASFEARLRTFGAQLARPLPEPRDVGAHLELWRDAEGATALGELRRAKMLWTKLADTSSLDDLCALRVAELYVMSGHVGEALARLRKVSRRYPRSTGAALARLDILALEALGGDSTPSADQIELAAITVDRRRFEGFAWLRAAEIFQDLGLASLAVARVPGSDDLPESWQDAARRRKLDALEDAVALPQLRGDPLATVIAYNAWSEQLVDHPNRLAILRTVADAHLALRMFEDAAPVLRELLRGTDRSSDEAELVEALAATYRELGDAVRLAEVVDFLLERHPAAPGLALALSSRAMLESETRGLAVAQDLLAKWTDSTAPADARRQVAAFGVDLAWSRGDAAARLRALEALRPLGWDLPELRARQLAVALLDSGRPAEAVPLLRRQIGRETDPEARDRLAYHLARAESALGFEDDAETILDRMGDSGTIYGRIARLALQRRQLQAVVDRLESQPAKESP